MADKLMADKLGSDLECTVVSSVVVPSSRWASVFGGSGVTIGPRISDVIDYAKSNLSESDDSSSAILNKQIAAESGNEIQYRTCSWQKTAALLFSEYICLAIMSFPWSYSVLGLVPGLILTVVVAATVLYTSIILWELCLRHPEIRDVCDLAEVLFKGSRIAWWGTSIMFVANNVMIAGLHVLVGAKYLNTMTEDDKTIGHCRTVMFSVVVTIVCWLFSLPRTFDMMAKIGTFSAIFTFISVILAALLQGIQGQPWGYDPLKLGEPIVSAWPQSNWVNGMAAFLNISYTFIGQITLPSFISEMKDPRDFPKALWACTIAEIFVFSIVGAVIYAYTGNQYVTAPAFGSLKPVFKKAAFSFMVPTIIFLGCLYASVTARFIFFRMFRGSKHLSSHTLVGWGSWAGILLATWILAFLIAQLIPFFGSLLSVMSSLFDSWFGFIFWAVAFFRMRNADKAVGRKHSKVIDILGIVVNIILFLTGVLFLTVGTYASVQGIIDQFEADAVSGVFSCASNGI